MQAGERVDRGGPVAKRQSPAGDRQPGAERGAEVLERGSRLLLERLVVEAIRCGGQASQEVGLALATSPMNDGYAQAIAAGGGKRGEIPPLVETAEEVLRSGKRQGSKQSPLSKSTL